MHRFAPVSLAAIARLRGPMALIAKAFSYWVSQASTAVNAAAVDDRIGLNLSDDF